MEKEILTSIVINLVIVAFFAGIYVSTIRSHGEKIKELKEYFSEKFTELKDDFKEQLNRVEEKQDKHNNFIERVVRVEDKSSSNQKRINALEEFQHDCVLRKRD